MVNYNGIVYNSNEIGNLIWGLVLTYNGIFLDPNTIAELGSVGRSDEAWEQNAISIGKAMAKTRKLHNNLYGMKRSRLSLLFIAFCLASCARNKEIVIDEQPNQQYEKFISKIAKGIIGSWEITQISFIDAGLESKNKGKESSRTFFEKGNRVKVVFRENGTYVIDDKYTGTFSLKENFVILKGDLINTKVPIFLNSEYMVGIAKTCIYLTGKYTGTHGDRHEIKYILINTSI